MTEQPSPTPTERLEGPDCWICGNEVDPDDDPATVHIECAKAFEQRPPAALADSATGPLPERWADLSRCPYCNEKGTHAPQCDRPATGPLDVERLAEAYHMAQLCPHGIGAGEPMQKPGYLAPDREHAALIADEYRRLDGGR